MTTTGLPIITEIKTMQDFSQLLSTNPGKLVIKFGAEWCGPCKKIEKQVHEWIDKMPATVQCCVIDIDESFELYAFLKNKKRVNGIPAILCYHSGNLNYIPDDAVIGADVKQVDLFFERCLST
jgi:thioredoxin 1